MQGSVVREVIQMTMEEVYVKYLCSNCKNENMEECEIRKRIDKTTYCYGYIKDKELQGYQKPIILNV